MAASIAAIQNNERTPLRPAISGAVPRMRMQHQRRRRGVAGAVLITPFQASFGTVKFDFRHVIAPFRDRFDRVPKTYG